MKVVLARCVCVLSRLLPFSSLLFPSLCRKRHACSEHGCRRKLQLLFRRRSPQILPHRHPRRRSTHLAAQRLAVHFRTNVGLGSARHLGRSRLPCRFRRRLFRRRARRTLVARLGDKTITSTVPPTMAAATVAPSTLAVAFASCANAAARPVPTAPLGDGINTAFGSIAAVAPISKSARPAGNRLLKQTIYCASDDMRRKTCPINTQGGARIIRQRSDADCIYGRTWGYDARGIWVDRGCRADFEVGIRR